MLLPRVIGTYFRRRHEHKTRDEVARREVTDLAGFNKLVSGRHGFFVANENDLYVGRALIAYGEFSELEWSFLERYCRPGDFVVEVGSNIGAHTVSIAQAVGPRGRVVAIEPQPFLFQTLCANVALNCLLNVDTLNCGCAERSCVLSIPSIDYAQPGNFGGISLAETQASSPIGIRCETLDSLMSRAPRLDLIKLDVEGMESDVLAGAARIVERFKPVLYIENDRPEKSKALIERIHALGYRAWWHTPPLFNPDNYYANPDNLFPRVVSMNMICVHASSAQEVAGLPAVVLGDPHPLEARREASA